MRKFNVERRILKKSVDLFFKYGFARASIRDIVRAVGISNSTIYIYFESKDEILYRIILNVGSDLLKELRSVIKRHSDPAGCLKEMILKQISFSMKENKKMKLYLDEQNQLSPKLRKKTHKQHREIYDLYYSKICQLAERGLLYPADKRVITFTIFAMMNWIYRWYNPKGKLTVEDIARDTIDIYFRGILKKPGKHGINQWRPTCLTNASGDRGVS